MSNWVCPSCSRVVPSQMIGPSGAFTCPNCQSELRLAQPFNAVLALCSVLLPFAILIWADALTLPWIILAFIFAPYGKGTFLLLTRSVLSLPLIARRGPLDHFSIHQSGGQKEPEIDEGGREIPAEDSTKLKRS
jgi:hypothetical protein